MIQCSIEIVENRIYTNYDSLDNEIMAKLKLLNRVSESNVYERPLSDLKMISDRCDFIFLRNPTQLVDRCKISYQSALEQIGNPFKIYPYTDYNGLDINYNNIPVKKDISDVKEFNKSEKIPVYQGYFAWNTIFLYSWIRLHGNSDNYLLKGNISYTYQSDVEAADVVGQFTGNDRYDTLTMFIYEHECAYYLVPYRIFKYTKGCISPIKFHDSADKSGLRDPYYECKFIVDRENFSLDMLKELKKYGSLFSGSLIDRLSKKEISTIGGTEFIPKHYV